MDSGNFIPEVNRIRLCVLNYYIHPDLELGKRETSIQVGHLVKNMGLENGIDAICSALTEARLLDGLPEPSLTGPSQSSSTVITYRLSSTNTQQPISPPTNLILYGPPGTGKTHATTFEAVRLCIGDEAAEPLQKHRHVLLDTYRRLKKERRIDFVTFPPIFLVRRIR